MLRTVRARFSGGSFLPLEELDFAEGEEVLISFDDLAPRGSSGVEDSGAGGWQGLVDTEQLKQDIYASRQMQTRPAPKL